MVYDGKLNQLGNRFIAQPAQPSAADAVRVMRVVRARTGRQRGALHGGSASGPSGDGANRRRSAQAGRAGDQTACGAQRALFAVQGCQ